MRQTIEQYMNSLDVTPKEILDQVDKAKLAYDRRINKRNKTIIKKYFEHHIDVDDLSTIYGITRTQINKIIKTAISKIYMGRE